MQTAGDYADSTLLSNGKVLVCGGNPSAKSCEIYNHSTGTWTVAKDMNTGRHARVFSNNFLQALPNGKVIAFGQSASTGLKTQTSTEFYDVSANTWTDTSTEYVTCTGGFETSTISTTCVSTFVDENTIKTVCPATCADQTVHVPA